MNPRNAQEEYLIFLIQDILDKRSLDLPYPRELVIQNLLFNLDIPNRAKRIPNNIIDKDLVLDWIHIYFPELIPFLP